MASSLCEACLQNKYPVQDGEYNYMYHDSLLIDGTGHSSVRLANIFPGFPDHSMVISPLFP